MDRELSKNQKSNLSASCQPQRHIAKALALTGVGLLLMGCQATQFGQTSALPIPASSLAVSYTHLTLPTTPYV